MVVRVRTQTKLSIDRIGRTKKVKSEIYISKAMAFVGRGNCGKKDVSTYHDDYLAGMRKSKGILEISLLPV